VSNLGVLWPDPTPRVIAVSLGIGRQAGVGIPPLGGFCCKAPTARACDVEAPGGLHHFVNCEYRCIQAREIWSKGQVIKPIWVSTQNTWVHRTHDTCVLGHHGHGRVLESEDLAAPGLLISSHHSLPLVDQRQISQPDGRHVSTIH
jgi:hypothetical protein